MNSMARPFVATGFESMGAILAGSARETERRRGPIRMSLVNQNGIDLPRIGGSTTHLPARRHEDAQGKSWFTTDFRGTAHCERCGGNHDRKTGEILGHSGILVIGLRAKRQSDGSRRELKPDEWWTSIAVACDCIYGAWRHAVQDMPYADQIPGVPRWLTARQWHLLAQAALPGDSYLSAAERVHGEDGWDDVFSRISEIEEAALI